MKVISKVLVLTILLSIISCVSSGDEYRSFNTIGYKKRSKIKSKRPLISIEVEKNESGKHILSLNSPVIPGITINGQVSIEAGEIVYYITDVRLFSNWENGWTEGFYEASGKYVIEKKSNSNYKFKEVDKFELWDIVSGEIRYHDSFFRADDGMWKVKNRVDRLKEVTRILHKDFNLAPVYGSNTKATTISGKFEDSVYLLLFPELYKFEKLEQKNSLPKTFYGNTFEKETVKGNGIKWRVDYTKSVFPEQLWELRDTGTMYRDAQEAPNILLSLYNLDGFINDILLKEIIVKEEE